jgi:hypothetical protein
MSRYHRVKAKPGKSRPAKSPRKEALEKQQELADAISESAQKLYIERGGAAIDAAVKRAEKTLALYDKELDALSERDEDKHRWKISPSVALRWERELERQQKRRLELLNQCTAMASELVLQWIDDTEKAAAKQQTQSAPGNAPAAAGVQAPATGERSHAEAGSSAAA